MILLGTTSACAENTPDDIFENTSPGNYLRVRGEYTATPAARDSEGELPPRARRILQGLNRNGLEPGTTSACAENTINISNLI